MQFSPDSTDARYAWISGQSLLTPSANYATSATQYEYSTNDINIAPALFSQSSKEYAQQNIALPDWDGGVVRAKFYWSPAGGSAAQYVTWGIQGRAYASDDALDQALGTPQEVDSTYTADDDLIISDETPGVTLAGNPGDGRWCMFQVYRDGANDDMAGAARLIAVLLSYTTG
jgi:hypothetical protein